MGQVKDPEVVASAETLLATLHAFRREHGFGRGIAAPQIGVSLRMVALAMEGWPEILLDPEITWRSEGTMTLWDDCMSFPGLLVRLRRHRSISVRFLDRDGRMHHRDRLDPEVSELLQHEIDHLDGVLAVDRALDRDSLVLREVWERDRERLSAPVDWPRE